MSHLRALIGAAARYMEQFIATLSLKISILPLSLALYSQPQPASLSLPIYVCISTDHEIWTRNQIRNCARDLHFNVLFFFLSLLFYFAVSDAGAGGKTSPWGVFTPLLIKWKRFKIYISHCIFFCHHQKK